MHHNLKQLLQSFKAPRRQRGAALIFIAFILGLAVAAYTIKAFNTASMQSEQDEKTTQVLGEAKAALIAWAVSHPNVPGMMPYPDRNNDGNYDDTSDCYATNVSFASYFVLGRLPLFKSDPNCVNAAVTVTSGVSGDFRDGVGERLWYEVSRNLLYDYQSSGTAPIINPGIANNPTYAWMTVRDRNGVLLSNRVAAVILSPGLPIGAQDRSGGIANANQYLDKVVMADGTPYQNYGYPDPATNPIQEFIIGDDFRTVAKNDPTYKNQLIEPYYFNDKLVFITIDELMAAVEKRTAMEARAALNQYKTTNGYFPYAAALGSVTNANQCVSKNLQGLLPTNSPQSYSCSCTYTSAANRNCKCSFSAVSTTLFTRSSSGTYGSAGAAAPTGACVVQNSDKTCKCNGVGTCKSTTGLTVQFSCDACGYCKSTVAGDFSFESNGTFASAPINCALSGNVVTCNVASAATMYQFTLNACVEPALSTLLPGWFTANQWQDYIYYAVQRGTSPTLTAGTRSGITALTITTGRPINTSPFAAKGSAQVRPSCDLTDHMDTIPNATGYITNYYESVDKQRSQTYNDQVFVVSP